MAQLTTYCDDPPSRHPFMPLGRNDAGCTVWQLQQLERCESKKKLADRYKWSKITYINGRK